MARKPMVTRTIKSIDCVVLCVNPETRETFEKTFTLSGKVKDDKILSQVAGECDEGCKPVAVIRTTEQEKLYGMTEEEFMQYATVMPGRKSPNADESEN